MNLLTICPCCSTKMWHCIARHRTYWFCRSCWQEMPDLETVELSKGKLHRHTIDLSTRLERIEGVLSS